MSLSDNITVSEELDAWLRETRRMIHVNPELLCEEVATSELVQKHLTEVGVSYRKGVGGDGRPLYMKPELIKRAGIKTFPITGGTGVLAEIRGTRGAGPGKCVLLRADMDALPMDELNDVEYKSQNPGKMHACGHDCHTTILMGVAEVLQSMSDKFDGTVKLMFQPGEEGAGGAVAMIHDGILEDPPVDAAFALHVSTEHPAGEVSMGPGPHAAAADSIEINVTGKGGHAAFPHTTIDATLVAAQILIALQTLVSREVDPIQTAVVSISTLHAGTAGNVIPQTAQMTGTVRTYDPAIRDMLEQRMGEMVPAIASGFRAEAELIYMRGYPAMVNDPEMTQFAMETCEELLGDDNVHVSAPMMAGEDFAYVTERVPGCMISLGVRNDERGMIYPPHHPRFDADEDALAVGVRVLSAIALRYLGADL
ncbi:MAG: M20 family metallopeptidase [Thermomicrobiales bacterium]|nr:M20 family metallopeptidase [Thermomicrobiales bacterium]